MAKQGWGSGYKGGRGGQQNSQAGSGGSNVWGSGFRGQQPQQQQNFRVAGGSGSRFAALDDREDNDRAFQSYRSGGRGGTMPPQDQQQRGGRGRGRGQLQGNTAHNQSWQDIVKQDYSAERPTWPWTCYGHQRNGQNDLLGDISYEELRWQQLQTLRSGASQQQLVKQLKDAHAASERHWQALLIARTPPSLGGPPIHQQQQQSGETVFGRLGGGGAGASGMAAFGAPQPLQPFGSAASPGRSPFGLSAVTARPAFGNQQQAGPFSGLQSPLQTAQRFSGAATSSPFPAVSTGGFGSNKQGFGAGGSLGGGGGFGFGGAGRTVFGGGNSSDSRFGHSSSSTEGGSKKADVFGAFASAPSVNPPPTSAGTTVETGNGNSSESELSAWRAATFEAGQVPESPPPRAVCT